MGSAPATPPGVRVRTGKFGSLRSKQARHHRLVEVRNAKHGPEKPVAVEPPATAVQCHLPGHTPPPS